MNYKIKVMRSTILALAIGLFVSCQPPDEQARKQRFDIYFHCTKSKISDMCFCCVKRYDNDTFCSFGNDSSFATMSCHEAENGFGFKVIK